MNFPSTLLLLFSAVLAPSSHAQELPTALRNQGFTRFAASLENTPAVLRRFDDRYDITIFAPINSCYETTTPPPTTNSTVTRRSPISEEEARNALHGAHTGPPPTIFRRQNVGGDSASNFVTLTTFLENDEWVNLGLNQPARVEQSYVFAPAGSDKNCTDAQMRIRTGIDGSSKQSGAGPWKWDRGLIYGVDAFFVLPKPMGTSLQTVGLTKFISAAATQGQTSYLETTPSITVFAVEDSSTGTYTVVEHIVSGLQYTAELIEKKTFQTVGGTTITISRKTDGVYVNDAKIIKSDISVKNGVVHTLSKGLSADSHAAVAQYTGAAAGRLVLGGGFVASAGALLAAVAVVVL